jgi:hypothetical protein
MKRFSMVVSLGVVLLLLGHAAVASATHPRPAGAGPIRVALGPAFEPLPCGAPNAYHPPGLRVSCIPPVPSSAHLTVGTPDANGQAAASTGFVRYAVQAGDPGPPDDSDVLIVAELTDVRNQSDLSDYAGELLVRNQLAFTSVAGARVTDHQNGPAGSGGGTAAGTTIDAEEWAFAPVTVPCTATPGTSVGSTCDISTSANALTPGAIKDTKRMVVRRLGPVHVYDGGADGVAETSPADSPNTLFAREGIFVP